MGPKSWESNALITELISFRMKLILIIIISISYIIIMISWKQEAKIIGILIQPLFNLDKEEKIELKTQISFSFKV